jgi:hypothetical protein
MKILFPLIFLLIIQGSGFKGTAIGATPIPPGGLLSVPTGNPEAGTVIAHMSSRVMGSILSGKYDFSVVLKHVLGTREFAGSSAGTHVYYNAVTSDNLNKEIMGLTLSHSSTEDFADWSEL